MGSEFIRCHVEGDTPLTAPKHAAQRIALIAETAADARDVMIEGESGILSCSHPDHMPLYEPSKRQITWKNGIIAKVYNATEPDQLRGPQHDLAWGDEIAKWRYLVDTIDNLEYGLRLGVNPRVLYTTTPRPLKFLKDTLKDKTAHITRGTTYDNIGNLAPKFIDRVVKKHEGTRKGRQELRAEILDDTPGALWTRGDIEKGRISLQRKPTEFRRIVVAIDPAVTSTEESDETGIMVVAIGFDDEGYVLEDISGTYSPGEWAKKAITAYEVYEADCIIGEVNNGGDMVEHTIRTQEGGDKVHYKAVRASRGKRTRAEPIAALYEQGKIHHVGAFIELEDQMCEWNAKGNEPSPDRMDANVWGLTELFLEPETEGFTEGMKTNTAETEEPFEQGGDQW